jgi:hypothetical protein
VRSAASVHKLTALLNLWSAQPSEEGVWHCCTAIEAPTISDPVAGRRLTPRCQDPDTIQAVLWREQPGVRVRQSVCCVHYDMAVSFFDALNLPTVTVCHSVLQPSLSAPPGCVGHGSGPWRARGGDLREGHHHTSSNGY